MERLNILTFLKKYKNKWINYCEIIIDTEGKVILANPSHTEAMLKLTGRDRNEIYNEMPIIASPIHWFVNCLGYISVWHQLQILPKELTKKQEKTLEILINHNMIEKNFEVVSDFQLGIKNK